MACLWLSPGQDANCHYLISLGKASFTAGLTLTFPGWTGPASGLEEGHRGHMDPHEPGWACTQADAGQTTDQWL